MRFYNFISFAFVLLLTCRAFASDINVGDFGASGDGHTDDTAAFQQALD